MDYELITTIGVLIDDKRVEATFKFESHAVHVD